MLEYCISCQESGENRKGRGGVHVCLPLFFVSSLYEIQYRPQAVHHFKYWFCPTDPVNEDTINTVDGNK